MKNEVRKQGAPCGKSRSCFASTVGVPIASSRKSLPRSPFDLIVTKAGEGEKEAKYFFFMYSKRWSNSVHVAIRLTTDLLFCLPFLYKTNEFDEVKGRRNKKEKEVNAIMSMWVCQKKKKAPPPALVCFSSSALIRNVIESLGGGVEVNLSSRRNWFSHTQQGVETRKRRRKWKHSLTQPLCAIVS